MAQTPPINPRSKAYLDQFLIPFTPYNVNTDHFYGTVAFSNTANQIQVGDTTGPVATLTCPTPAANQSVTIPDAGVDTTILLTSGNKTFSGPVVFSQGFSAPNVVYSSYTYAILENIADLRAFTDSPTKLALIGGYYISCDGGGGRFSVSASDTTSADNGGTIIVDTLGRRWYRDYSTRGVQAKHFGAYGNGTNDDTAALQLWLNFCSANSVRGLMMAGSYIVTSTLFLGNNTTLVLDVNANIVYKSTTFPSSNTVVFTQHDFAFFMDSVDISGGSISTVILGPHRGNPTGSLINLWCNNLSIRNMAFNTSYGIAVTIHGDNVLLDSLSFNTSLSNGIDYVGGNSFVAKRLFLSTGGSLLSLSGMPISDVLVENVQISYGYTILFTSTSVSRMVMSNITGQVADIFTLNAQISQVQISNMKLQFYPESAGPTLQVVGNIAQTLDVHISNFAMTNCGGVYWWNPFSPQGGSQSFRWTDIVLSFVTDTYSVFYGYGANGDTFDRLHILGNYSSSQPHIKIDGCSNLSFNDLYVESIFNGTPPVSSGLTSNITIKNATFVDPSLASTTPPVDTSSGPTTNLQLSNIDLTQYGPAGSVTSNAYLGAGNKSSNIFGLASSSTYTTVASASSITFNDQANLWMITGTATIATITAPPSTDYGFPRVQLYFSGSSTVVTDTDASGPGNINLRNPFTASAGDMLLLDWCPYTSKWVEAARQQVASNVSL